MGLQGGWIFANDGLEVQPACTDVEISGIIAGLVRGAKGGEELYATIVSGYAFVPSMF
jgi:hypothetical protein